MNPLRDAGKGTGGGFRGGRLSSALVIAEIALSLVLMNSAGLLMRSFMKLQTQELGLESRGCPRHAHPGRYQAASRPQPARRSSCRRRSSGFAVCRASSTLPPRSACPCSAASEATSTSWGSGTRIAGGETSVICSDGYFRTLKIPLLRGRDFTADDMNTARKVALVNQTFVDRFLNGSDAIGRRLVLKLADDNGHPVDQALEIVGVVASAKNRGPSDPPAPEAFVPMSIAPGRSQGLLIRTRGTPRAMVQTIKHEIWAVDPAVAIADTDELMGFIRRFSYAAPRLGVFVFGAFAGLGLALVVLGVYSLIAYTIARQTARSASVWPWALAVATFCV